MSSLVERLRVRSERRPIYILDESDDDADFVLGKPGKSPEKFERIVRPDAVCFLLFLLLSAFPIFVLISTLSLISFIMFNLHIVL